MMTPPPRPTRPLSIPAIKPTTRSKRIVGTDILKLFFPEGLVIEMDSVFDDFDGGCLIAELFHDHGFVLQLFVLFEKVAKLFEKMLRELFDIIVMIDAGVM